MFKVQHFATCARILGIVLQHVLWWAIALSCAMRMGDQACIIPFS